MSKIINTTKNLRDRVSASVTIKKQNILFYTALFLVFILAIWLRLSPLLQDEQLIKAFDPWIQYYNAEYLSQNGPYEYFIWHDIKSWYPQGIDRFYLRPGLTFTVVFFHDILNFLGLPISLYDVCYFFPAFMAGLTVLAIYFLGKEILDRKVGLLAAFFLAFSPGYMQRTIAGFFDNETIGVFATIMTFLFFLKTLRTGRTTYSILGGIFSGYLALSWGGYEFVFYTIPIVCILLILLNKYNSNVLIAYAGVQGVGLLIASFYYFFKFEKLFTSIDIGGILLFTILIIFYHILYTRKKTMPNTYRRVTNFIKWGIIPTAIVVAVIIWVNPKLIPFGIGARLNSVLNPLFRNQINLVASVAEHMPSSWSVFYYDILIPLMLLPLGIYFCFKRYNSADIFLLVFTLLLFYFTGSMIRIMLVFAPAAALMGSYGLVNVLKIFGSFHGKRKVGVSRKRTKLMRRKKTLGKKEVYGVYLIVGFLCLVQVTHAVDISVQMSSGQMVPGGVLHDWEESLTWMQNNLPGDTVVVSWWDYGYWLTPIGNMTTVNDNANINSSRNGLTGMALMQTNEIYSAKILKLLKADYVLVYFGFLYDGLGGDEGKWQWMLRICNDHYEKYKRWGLEEDNWKETSVFDEEEYYNDTSYRQEDKWFDSQLAKLMFYGLPTVDEPYEGHPDGNYADGTIIQDYINKINARPVDNGGFWADKIPTNGNYQFDVFRPPNPNDPGDPNAGYFSSNLLVKLYKIDYTPLESQFIIEEPQIFDSGYGTVKVKNIGTKEIIISDIKVNNETRTFDMGRSFGNNKLEEGEEDIIWFNTSDGSGASLFNEYDTAQLEITATSEALGGRTYTFSNSTSYFFVKEAKPGNIKIIRENSIFVYNETTGVDDGYIEVENIGENPIVIDSFYVNSINNKFTTVDYIEGSSIIEPGATSLAYLPNSPVPFSMRWGSNIIGTMNNVSVVTMNDVEDTTIFTSNLKTDTKQYQLSIIPQERIVSPEFYALTDASIRNYISPDAYTNAFTYENGSTIINLKVKNTGTNKISLYELSLLNGNWSFIDSSDYQWTPAGGYLLNVTEETIININVDSNVFKVNDEIGMSISAYFDDKKVASDAGFIYTLNGTVGSEDIKILNKVHGYNASSIYVDTETGNATGWITVKNVGISDLTLNVADCVSAVSLTTSKINITYGDIDLGPQECAILEFALSGGIDRWDTIIIIIETVEGISDELELTAIPL